MGRWWQTDNDLCEVDIGDGVSTWADTPDGAELFIQSHNADCDAYEAKIAELERKLAEYEHASGAGHPQPCTLGPLCPYCRIAELERRDDIVSRERAAAEIRCAELECRLARLAALVKPVPVAELVEAGTEAPALLAERHRQIRAILEDEG